MNNSSQTINWGEELFAGVSIGTDLIITDRKSLHRGKTGFAVGTMGNDLLVTIMADGEDQTVVVSKKGIQILNTI